MDLGLTGRTAVVTGGGGGLGRFIAAAFSMEGADVVVCGRRREPLEDAAAEITAQTGGRVLPVTVDVTDRESVSRMVEQVVAAQGRLDVLVNNAATPGGLVRGTLAEASDVDLLADLDVKSVGYFRCAQAVAPVMSDAGWGRIVNVGGMSGRTTHVISGMRNAAVVHLTRVLANQLGPHGITVNALHPGGTLGTRLITERHQDQAERDGLSVEDVDRRNGAVNDIGRYPHAREVSDAIVFLASDRAGAITGTTLDASGGSLQAAFA